MVEEELDETAYWLELIMELRLVKPELLGGLYADGLLVRINHGTSFSKTRVVGRSLCRE